ncbi:MAG: CapA family protein [Clostridiales bacterium]|nr:CapA family protein [Clostridiales bacterium]
MKKKRRGISFGTIFMLALTVIVVFAIATVLPKLSGDTVLKLNPQEIVTTVFSVVDLPELALLEIPIENAAQPANDLTDGEINSQREGEQVSVPSPQTPMAIAPVQEAPLMTETEQPIKKQATLTLTGTVDFKKGLRQSEYNAESKSYDFRHLLAYVEDEMVGDITIATLENTIAASSKVGDVNTVPQALIALKNGGINVLSIGNEHILDYGIKGLTETSGEISRAGFSVVGVNTGGVQGQHGLIVDAGNMKIGILSYVDNLTSTGEKQLKKEEAQNSILLYDGASVATHIGELRSSGAEVVVVMMHWGKDNQKEITSRQKEIAQQVANAGGDILLGGHTERVFPIEYTTGIRGDGKQTQMLTVYSLGALLTQERGDANCGGVLLHVQIGQDSQTQDVKIEKVTYTPTYIWRYQKEDKNHAYRVVASDQPAPEGMSGEQEKVKEKILGVVQTSLGESPVTIREKKGLE